MRLFDIDGKPTSINITSNKYAIGKIYRSKLQTDVGEHLQQKFQHEIILEDFIIPGSKMSVDFFIPRLQIIIEVDGQQHDNYSSFLHGEKSQNKFAGQKIRDVKKERWAEMNDFDFYRIKKLEDLEQLNGI